jgi:hypothetical protein
MSNVCALAATLASIARRSKIFFITLISKLFLIRIIFFCSIGAVLKQTLFHNNNPLLRFFIRCQLLQKFILQFLSSTFTEIFSFPQKDQEWK